MSKLSKASSRTEVCLTDSLSINRKPCKEISSVISFDASVSMLKLIGFFFKDFDFVVLGGPSGLDLGL